jgi:hypothetical protein
MAEKPEMGTFSNMSPQQMGLLQAGLAMLAAPKYAPIGGGLVRGTSLGERIAPGMMQGINTMQDQRQYQLQLALQESQMLQEASKAKREQEQLNREGKLRSALSTADLTDRPTVAKLLAQFSNDPLKAMEYLKADRSGVPSGFDPTDSGGMKSKIIDMGNGQSMPYSDFIMQQASQKAQIPGYGEDVRLNIAHQGNLRAEEANNLARMRFDADKANRQYDLQRQQEKEQQVQEGRPLPAHNAQLLGEAGNLSTGVLGGLEKLITDNSNMFDPILGKVHEINPYDVKGQEIDAELRRARQTIGSYLEGGVLRKEDEIKYETMLPKLSDKPEVAKEKLKGIKQLIENKKREYINSYEDAGFNVKEYNKRSGFSGEWNVPDSAKPAGTVSNIKLSPAASMQPKEVRDKIQEVLTSGSDADKAKLLQKGYLIEGK